MIFYKYMTKSLRIKPRLSHFENFYFWQNATILNLDVAFFKLNFEYFWIQTSEMAKPIVMIMHTK